MKKAFYSIIFLFCINALSCRSEADIRLEYALEFAAENRPELEKVLEHYKDSTEKRAAARFLIENMPRWFAYEGWQLDSIKAIYRRIKRYNYLPEEETKIWENFQYTGLTKVYDSKVITSGYLIDHIDRVFAMRKRRPWNKYLSFKDFCEFLLPYRISNEPLEAWHKAYSDRYAARLDSMYQGSDVVEACRLTVNLIRKEGLTYNDAMEHPHLGGLFLLDCKIGKCTESCDLAVYVMRSLGIPASTDYYIFSPSRRNGHAWNVVMDTTGIPVPFWIDENNAARGQSDGRKKGKVYRRCFGLQPALAEGMQSHPGLAAVFKNRFIKDATSDYFGKNRLEVALPTTTGYAYLCVFNVKDWQPIAVTNLKNGLAVFADIEPNTIYQVRAINEYGISTHGYPLTFDGQNTHFFCPDTTSRETIELTRKYPTSFNLFTKISRVVGGKLEGACKNDFSDTRMVYTIADTPQTSFNYLYFPEPLNIRYLRYTPLTNVTGDIAELAAYPTPTDTVPYPSAATATGTFSPEWKTEYVNDGDPLTLASVKAGHITLDFGKTVKISKILYIPRNDDNFIRKGDTYELFYCGGDNRWISLGKKTARESRLTYTNIPHNALLWLKDLTRGDEEQVFFCKDGKQVFLSDNLHSASKDLYNLNAL